MIEVRVGKKHDVDFGEVANGQGGRGQAFRADCKTGQPGLRSAETELDQ